MGTQNNAFAYYYVITVECKRTDHPVERGVQYYESQVLAEKLFERQKQLVQAIYSDIPWSIELRKGKSGGHALLRREFNRKHKSPKPGRHDKLRYECTNDFTLVGERVNHLFVEQYTSDHLASTLIMNRENMLFSDFNVQKMTVALFDTSRDKIIWQSDHR